MLLYKYKSLENLWFVLDIITHQRIYCAHWSELNDPLEGRYEIYLGKNAPKDEGIMHRNIQEARDSLRVGSLSRDAGSYLLWSHYAEGHKGITIEIDIPEDAIDLCKVIYTEFSSIFTMKIQSKEDMRHLFNGKPPEWEYEKEYRLITDSTFYNLPNPVRRVFLGPRISEDRRLILKELLPNSVEIVRTEIDDIGNITAKP